MHLHLFFFLDESTLSIGNEVGHVKSKAGGHHLSNDLCNSMNKTYGPEVRDVLRPIFFREEHNVSRVEPVEVVDMKIGEIIDD